MAIIAKCQQGVRAGRGEVCLTNVGPVCCCGQNVDNVRGACG
jgi:hypothetical protein